MNTSFFKNKARQQLAGKWMVAALVCFISWIMSSAFLSSNGAQSFRYTFEFGRLVRVPAHNNGTFRDLAQIINFVLAGPVNFGVAAFFIKIVRRENAIIEDMFIGFKYFINTFVLNLLYSIFVFLWMLLLIIPGFVAILKYSMAYYIMNDNPNVGAMDALKQSKEMMYGHKMELFTLWFSFIGWFLLGFFTAGIGLLWAIPYYTTAKINFYESIKPATHTFNGFRENSI